MQLLVFWHLHLPELLILFYGDYMSIKSLISCAVSYMIFIQELYLFIVQDLTISLGHNESDKVRCHKHIVAMVSDVIQAESVMKDEIIFSNIKRDILSQLIDYCYTQMIGPFVDKVHVRNVLRNGFIFITT